MIEEYLIVFYSPGSHINISIVNWYANTEYPEMKDEINSDTVLKHITNVATICSASENR